jgi:hypothetical protein
MSTGVTEVKVVRAGGSALTVGAALSTAGVLGLPAQAMLKRKISVVVVDRYSMAVSVVGVG